MERKINRYLYTKIIGDVVVVYNLLSKSVFALRKNDFDDIMSMNWALIRNIKPSLLSAMEKLGVVVPIDFDEISQIKMMNRKEIFDNYHYRLTINPTLECNFNCWYCYEKHPKSKMNEDVMSAVENHVKLKLDEKLLQALALDWFGGEPLIYFDDVIYPLSKRIKELSEGANILFNNSITTNGYLINDHMIDKFVDIGLTDSQITLDGDENMHNKIRFGKNKVGSFQTIIENINKMAEYREINSISVRINYTKETLKNINRIADVFTEKAKGKIVINFQQVWQDAFNNTISVDEHKNYLCSRGIKTGEDEFRNAYHVCYADKISQCVVNYDGRVFKCTARDFHSSQEDGILLSNGEIKWNMPVYAKRMGNATFENEYCFKCNLLPVCMGPCSQKMVEFRDGNNFGCICQRGGIKRILDSKIDKHYNQIKDL